MWLIGADEKAGTVPGAPPQELSAWWPKVVSQFETQAQAPVLTPLNVTVEGVTVVALVFTTDRPPYLVRNPANGQPGGGPVEFEVPWREGNATRTARRAELLTMLSELQPMPSVELLRADVNAVFDDAESREVIAPARWQVTADLYITPSGASSLVLPRHKGRMSLSAPRRGQPLEFPRPSFRAAGPFRPPNRPAPESNVRVTDSEVILSGPGMLQVFGIWNAELDIRFIGDDVVLALSLGVAGSNPYAVAAEARLHPAGLPDFGRKGKWEFDVRTATADEAGA
jgi:hypothetical protein